MPLPQAQTKVRKISDVIDERTLFYKAEDNIFE